MTFHKTNCSFQSPLRAYEIQHHIAWKVEGIRGLGMECPEGNGRQLFALRHIPDDHLGVGEETQVLNRELTEPTGS